MIPFGYIWPITIPEVAKIIWRYPDSLNVKMRLCCTESLNIKICIIPSYWSRPVHLFHILHQIKFLYLGFFSIIALRWKSSFSIDAVGPCWNIRNDSVHRILQKSNTR